MGVKTVRDELLFMLVGGMKIKHVESLSGYIGRRRYTIFPPLLLPLRRSPFRSRGGRKEKRFSSRHRAGLQKCLLEAPPSLFPISVERLNVLPIHHRRVGRGFLPSFEGRGGGEDRSI